jgi:hypothetical protein
MIAPSVPIEIQKLPEHSTALTTTSRFFLQKSLHHETQLMVVRLIIQVENR